MKRGAGMKVKHWSAIAIGMAVMMTGIPAWAGSATLSWYPPTEHVDGTALTNLAGYRIYYGKSATALNQSIVINNLGLTRYLIENLSRARWYFAMTAVSSQGTESARSTTVSKRVY